MAPRSNKKLARLVNRILHGNQWSTNTNKKELKQWKADAIKIAAKAAELYKEQHPRREWEPQLGTPTEEDTALVRQAQSMITGAASAPAPAEQGGEQPKTRPTAKREFTLGAGRPSAPPSPKPARLTRNVFGQYGDTEKPCDPASRPECWRHHPRLACGHEITGCTIDEHGAHRSRVQPYRIETSTSPGDNHFKYDREKKAWFGTVATLGRQGVTRKRR